MITEIALRKTPGGRARTRKILEMLSLIYEDLDINTVERRFFALTTEIFSFDRLALFFVKHRKGLLHGKLSQGFPDNQIEALAIPLSSDYIFTRPLITGIPITASLGVATYGADATSVERLMAKADKALYAAKAQGRNRVCQAE